MAKAMKFGSGKAKRYYQGGTATASTSMPVPEEGTGLQKETRDEAFARARRNKEKTFEYDGKTFTTEYKEEKAAREAKEKAKEDAEERRNSGIGDKYRAEKARVTALRPSDDEIKDIKAKQAGVTALRSSDKEIKDIKAKQAGRRKLPDPKYTKEINDALTMGLQGGILSKEIPKALRNLRTPKEVAERIEPTYKKGGKVKKMASGGKVRSASSRGDGIAQRGKTRA
jgi:hypothetical protein